MFLQIQKYGLSLPLFRVFTRIGRTKVLTLAPLPLKRDVGPFYLCNPNPSHPPKPFLPLTSPVLGLTRDIMSPKSEQRSLPIPSCIHAFLAHLNLNIIVEVFLPYQCFLLLWWDWLFLIYSNFTGMSDKGKPFERMGRKTTDLSNGGWVTELTSRISSAHSFDVKTELFFYEKSRGPSGGQS